ncbi:AbiTii domain-containing protein [Cupriavidus pinatubonensis]|uniref:AbiTii domain-containing protein n=1 Tax=Cupriavidus pinatubonensis TaxID=248026 RepID=UPI001C631E9C|nr:hypothetical protein [Cupriavidus pinatubonensis]
MASALLDDLESSASKVDAVLMRAKRLARLMRDTDAQSWLDFETKGYPESFNPTELGTCRKYAAGSGRLNGSKYYTSSLPKLEADAESEELLLSAPVPASSVSAKDFLEQKATEALMVTQLKIQNQRKTNFSQAKSLFSSIKSGIHSYATDVYLAIELGDIAQDIFESTRDEIDSFVRVHAPKAAEKLIAINERMAENSSESRTAALTSCRRLLMTVADSLFPPRDTDWIDAGGKPRKVGTEQYKNRLIAYISENVKSEGSASILESDLAYLAARLDAIYEKTCKGVHVDVTKQEARLAVIHTYLFIGELARCKEAPSHRRENGIQG